MRQVSLNFWSTTASAVTLIFRIFRVLESFRVSPSAFRVSGEDSFRALSLQFIFAQSLLYINYFKIILSTFNKSVSVIIYLIVYISCTFMTQLSLVQLAIVTSNNQFFNTYIVPLLGNIISKNSLGRYINNVGLVQFTINIKFRVHFYSYPIIFK